jgi:hypothetical protein
MYVTMRQGADTILLPNSAALASAIQPLREPASVDFTARLRPGVRVSDVQRLLEMLVDVPTREDQVLAAVDKVVTEDMTLEQVIGERPTSVPADRLSRDRSGEDGQSSGGEG